MLITPRIRLAMRIFAAVVLLGFGEAMAAPLFERPVSFRDGIIEIEVRVDQRLKKFTPEEMAVKLANSWHREPELSSATGYVAHVYKCGRPVGFVMPAGGRGRKALVEDMMDRFRGLATEYPDVLVEMVRTVFEGGTPNCAIESEPHV
jgi:hypothetical protein